MQVYLNPSSSSPLCSVDRLESSTLLISESYLQKMSIFALRDLRPREVLFIELSLIGSAILVAWFVVKSVIRYRKLSQFPLINGKRLLEFTWTPAKKRVHANAQELIQYGFT